jgi:hypothetical protein
MAPDYRRSLARGELTTASSNLYVLPINGISC